MAPAIVALLLSAATPEGRAFAVEPEKSVVRYHIVHKLHRVTGASSAIEGRGVLQPDGTALAMVRVPMASFDSGERNRDADMRDAVEAHRFPFVVFKGAVKLDGSLLAASQETSVDARMDGEVELHGVKKPVTVPLRIVLSPDGTARAQGSFDVSLDAFGVKRPSLLFVKIDDRCRIDVDLALREEKR
jgi:polyisoprenoid-binding protein YceI